MKATATGLILLSGLIAAALVRADEPANAEDSDQPMVVYADAQKQKSSSVRIRTSDIYSWTSDDDHKLVLTTKRREQFLIEFERPCFNLSLGPNSNALITDTSWLDSHGSVRVLNRDHLPPGHFSDFGGGSFRMATNAYSAYCPIKDITALGKKARAGKAKG